MTTEEFRRIALSMDGASESSHMGHPDFRVSGKIFATLSFADQNWGMVKLTPDEQRQFVEANPAIFQPVKGGWGRRGCTNVRLEDAEEEVVRSAMLAAWRNRASTVRPKARKSPR